MLYKGLTKDLSCYQFVYEMFKSFVRNDGRANFLTWKFLKISTWTFLNLEVPSARNPGELQH